MQGQNIRRQQTSSEVVKNGTPLPQRTVRSSNKHVVGASTTNKRLKSTVTTRSVDIFVSRLAPETTQNDVTTFAYDVLNKENDGSITCTKLKSKFDGYSSYHVSVVVNSVDMKRTIDQMMSVEAWPEGLLVRRYFKPKNV